MARHQRAPNADGVGIWAHAEIGKRYHAYCRKFGCQPRDIAFEPFRLASGTGREPVVRPWIEPIIREMIIGIARNDRACIEIGIELIEEDAKFAFGKIMKVNVAKKLRHAKLSEPQKERIRNRVVNLLARGLVPHEMREYARLMKRVGIGQHTDALAAVMDRYAEFGIEARYVQRVVSYLLDPKLGPKPLQ
jgi:hypothetical protein